MNRDLFLSILAMDSYNRGYGQGVFLNSGDSPTGQNELGRTLGLATITAQNITQAAKDADFYAIAYEWNGDTIISYRGTTAPPDPAFWQDVMNGWSRREGACAA